MSRLTQPVDLENKEGVNLYLEMKPAVPLILQFTRLSQRALAPKRMSFASCSFWLACAYDTTIFPKCRGMLYTDLVFSFPPGFYGQLHPRPGLMLEYEIEVGSGIIDCDYRGNVGVAFNNLSSRPYYVRRGDLIARMTVHRAHMPLLLEVKEVPETPNGWTPRERNQTPDSGWVDVVKSITGPVTDL